MSQRKRVQKSRCCAENSLKNLRRPKLFSEILLVARSTTPAAAYQNDKNEHSVLKKGFRHNINHNKCWSEKHAWSLAVKPKCGVATQGLPRLRVPASPASYSLSPDAVVQRQQSCRPTRLKSSAAEICCQSLDHSLLWHAVRRRK